MCAFCDIEWIMVFKSIKNIIKNGGKKHRNKLITDWKINYFRVILGSWYVYCYFVSFKSLELIFCNVPNTTPLLTKHPPIIVQLMYQLSITGRTVINKFSFDKKYQIIFIAFQLYVGHHI